MTICSSCHGAFDGGSLAASTEDLLHDLLLAIEANLLADINAYLANSWSITLTGAATGGGDVVVASPRTATAVVLTEYHGRTAMDITLDNGEFYSHVTLSSATVSDGGAGTGSLVSDNTAGTYSTNGQNIAKAAWNYFLLHSDSSNGVHNPSFYYDIIVATMPQLK